MNFWSCEEDTKIPGGNFMRVKIRISYMAQRLQQRFKNILLNPINLLLRATARFERES